MAEHFQRPIYETAETRRTEEQAATAIADCRLLARESGVPFVLFVWWLDGLFFLDATSANPSAVTVGGRKDRDDPSDIEPLVHFETSIFKPVQKRKAAA